MTTTNVERLPGGGGRRGGRSRTPDKLPQSEAAAREVHALKLRLSAFLEVYRIEHNALASLSASDVHVQTGPSDTTLSSVMDKRNEEARDRCRRAMKHLRHAATNVEDALKAFGPQAKQPEQSSDTVVSRSVFDRAVHRQQRERHEEREKELRSS